jgi:hypothetical protein
MNYIYDYISEERKKEIADMNIVDTYQHTGYLKIPTGRVVKSKDEHLLLWNNLADTLCLRQQIEETSSSDIGKERYNSSAYEYMKRNNSDNLLSTSISYMNESLSYGKMLENIDIVTKALLGMRIKKGDVVTIAAIDRSGNTVEVRLKVEKMEGRRVDELVMSVSRPVRGSGA